MSKFFVAALAARRGKNFFSGILKRWRARTFRKRFLSVFFALILGIGLYLFISLLSVSRPELALARLRYSFARETVCHEDCLIARSREEQAVAAALPARRRLAGKLRKYFLAEKESRAFKKELLKIIALAYGPDAPPEYVRAYVASAGADPELQAEILSLFNKEAFKVSDLIARWQAEIEASFSDSASTTATKALATFKTLKETRDDSLAPYYFSLLVGPAGNTLKEEAIVALSNIGDKKSYFSAEQVSRIKDLIMNSATDKHLRASLVLLLGDYYPLYPAQTVAVLTALYELASSDDAVSQAFAADLVNRTAGWAKLAEPTVSAEEWDEYFNN